MLRRLMFRFKRRKSSNFRPVILVTGCGSGIGLAIAELLAKQDRYRVVFTAREKSISTLKEKFQESDRLMIRSLDITSHASRMKLIDEIENVWGAIHILVNNAGISYRAVLEHMDEEDEQIQFATNYFGPTSLIRRVLPKMRLSGRGKIINVSSVSGMLAMPTMSSYSASKHALEGMSEALWYEVRPLGIDVSLIQPGFVHSNSFLNVRYSKKSKELAEIQGGVYSDYYQNMSPFIARLMRLSLTTPADVAAIVLRVIHTERPPLWIPATLDAWIFYYMRRLVPRRILMPLLFALLPRARKWGASYSKKRPGT